MIGELLDRRYRVTQVLAAGGFSQTYLAQDTRIPGQPLCVVKHLKPQTRDSQLLETIHRQFQREAEILARLGQYDQIPRLLAHFEENQEFYLVQEFVPGHPLTAELTPGTCWIEARVKTFLFDILQTLNFVHQHGVIHRDVKPANIIRRANDDKLVLIDFGAVKEIATTTTIGEQPPTVGVGTPIYMPIEQLKGYPQFSSDLYAVGVVAVQAASGLSINELQSAIDPDYPGKVIQWRDRVQLSSTLGNILAKLVQPNHRQRYQTPQEVLDELGALEAEASAAPATIIEIPASMLSQAPPLPEPTALQPPLPSGQPDALADAAPPRSSEPVQPADFNDIPNLLDPVAAPSAEPITPPTILDAPSSRPPVAPVTQLDPIGAAVSPAADESVKPRTAAAQKGRTYTIAAIAITLFVSLLNSAFLGASSTDGVRFLLTLALYYFLWQGHSWARWTTGVLVGLGSLLFLLASLGFVIKGQLLLAVWILFNGVLYGIATVLLLILPETKAFLAQQRSQRQR